MPRAAIARLKVPGPGSGAPSTMVKPMSLVLVAASVVVTPLVEGRRDASGAGGGECIMRCTRNMKRPIVS